MKRPSFFKPLHQMDVKVISLLDQGRALVTQIRALNSPDAEQLENEIIDINATLLDAQQHIIAARRLEKQFRKGK